MITRQQLETEARTLMGYLEHKFGRQKVGLMLLVFEFGDQGNLAYISNAQREDMIAVVEEWLARTKAGLATDPPGPRGEG